MSEKWTAKISFFNVFGTRTYCSRLSKHFTNLIRFCWLINVRASSRLKQKLRVPRVTRYPPVKQRMERSLCKVCCNNFVLHLKTISMRLLSREHFKPGIVFNAIFHCGLIFIGIVVLQAKPNGGFLQSKASQSSRCYRSIPAYDIILKAKIYFLISVVENVL